jgi:hypothetical protein
MLQVSSSSLINPSLCEELLTIGVARWPRSTSELCQDEQQCFSERPIARKAAWPSYLESNWRWIPLSENDLEAALGLLDSSHSENSRYFAHRIDIEDGNKVRDYIDSFYERQQMVWINYIRQRLMPPSIFRGEQCPACISFVMQRYREFFRFLSPLAGFYYLLQFAYLFNSV